LEAGYPERVEQFINEVLAVHPHKINARLLAQAEAASTAVNWTTPPSNFPYDTSALTRILEAASWAAEWFRYRYRFSFGTTMEVVLPEWVLTLSQNDFSRRPGDESYMTLNQQRIESYFAVRNIRVQWVYDWQDLGTNIATFNAPATAKMLVYPAGTFVKLTKNVLRFGTMYDSQLLSENMAQQLWTEEGIALMKRDYPSLAVTTSVCASGTVGAGTGACEAPETP
jgi:hypothetical protein